MALGKMTLVGKAGGKRRRRRRARRERTFKIQQLGVAIPKSQRVRMRFCGPVSIDSNGSSIAIAQYRANSIVDPDAALGGKNPLGYDQWKVWYNHYVVVGSRLTFKLFPTTNTTNIPNVVGVYLSDDTFIPNQYDSLIMQGRGHYKIVPTAQASGGAYTLTANFSARKFFNIKDVRDNVDRIGATFDSIPNEGSTFNLYCQPVDKLTNTGGFSGTVVIDYIVELSEPKDVPDST